MFSKIKNLHLSLNQIVSLGLHSGRNIAYGAYLRSGFMCNISDGLNCKIKKRMDAIDKIIKQMEMDVSTSFKIINAEHEKIAEVAKMAAKVGMWVNPETQKLERIPFVNKNEEPIIHNRVKY